MQSKGKGILIGLFGPVVGFLIFGVFYAAYFEISVMDFVEKFFNNRPMQSPILAVSLWFNGLVFYIVNKKDWVDMARGILLSTFLYAPVIVYLKFF